MNIVQVVPEINRSSILKTQYVHLSSEIQKQFKIAKQTGMLRNTTLFNQNQNSNSNKEKESVCFILFLLKEIFRYLSPFLQEKRNIRLDQSWRMAISQFIKRQS